MDEHWAVTVSRSGEEIVTIESNMLAGREISTADERAIRTAAWHLLSFIGDGIGAVEETAWLRRLLRWCRPRLKHPSYQTWLDKYLAAGPSPAPEDEPELIQSGSDNAAADNVS